MGWFTRKFGLDAPAIDYDHLASKVVAAMPPAIVQAAPLPRDQFGQSGPFSPAAPIQPYGIDPRDPATGRPDPRRSEFAVGVNMQFTAARMVPFETLRLVAERVDVMRRCVELRKSQMLALDWDIVLTRQSLRRIMTDEGITSPGKAAKIAREKFAGEMVRLRDWWETPDEFNQQAFSTWLGLLLEEQLVTDALAIFPRRQADGTVRAFEILDGTTIKPLLDHRGSTPMAPNPAYQQMLYGAPRGEFTATSSNTADGYTTSSLIYRPRFTRTWTPYGCPNTEQALSAADIYLKRMAWIRNEFTEGTTPDTWLTTPADTAKMDPSNIRAWEAAINAELAGNDVGRRHLRMLPPGYAPDQMKNFAELYQPDLDEFLIKMICACFDVMPTEIGFAPKGGIGGKGHQEGEANSAQRKAVRPTAVWIGDLLTEISRIYLGMPAELEFKLLGYEIEDQNAEEEVSDSKTRGGRKTINEDRADQGLTLFDFEEADTPFIVTGAGVTFLPGAIAAQAAAAMPPPAAPAADTAPDAPVADTSDPVSPTDPRPADDAPEAGDPIADDDPVPEGFIRVAGHLRRKQGAAVEAAKFAKFATGRQGRSWRDFEFVDVDSDTASVLNEMGARGRLDVVKMMVADLGKAKARRVSRAAKDKLVATHAKKIAATVAALLPSAGDLVDGWTATKAADDPQAAARAYVEDQMGVDYDDLDGDLEEFIRAGHQAAWEAAWITDEDDDPDAKVSTALDKVLAALPDTRDVLVGLAVGAVADAIRSDDAAGNTAAALDGAGYAEPFTATELTPALSAGTIDSAQQQQIFVVQIVTSAGECEFCEGYAGRILHIDETDGMPPLHRGCACDIEPLN